MKITEYVTKKVAGTPHEEHWLPGLELQIEAANGWKARLPANGREDPTDNDGPLPCEPEEVLRIGTSGWKYRDLVTDFVAIDVDAEEGHGAGLSEERLQEVVEAASQLDYVQTHHSKGGKGVHLYIRLETPVAAPTRREHALVALAVLEQMKADTGFDFAGSACCKGVISWLWAADAAPNGFQLLKPATSSIVLPDNWQEIAIAAKRVRKAPGVSHAGTKSIGFSPQHEEHIEWLISNGWAAYVDAYDEHDLLRTHTAGLKEMHKALGLPGVFDTVSAGTNPYEANCFGFPRDNGGWALRRYGQGVKEAPCWEQTSGGWTACDFGVPATLGAAAAVFGGIEDPKGGFVFDPGQATEAVRAMGGTFTAPEEVGERPILLKPHTDGKRLVAEIPVQRSDAQPKGWLKKGRKFTRVVDAQLGGTGGTESGGIDDLIRHVGTEGGENIGWAFRSDGMWISQTKGNCQSVLLNRGMTRLEADAALGGCISNMWRLVDLPFQPEYPNRDRRQWNRFGAQLAFQPTTEEGPMHHPSFDLVLDHCGATLTPAVRRDPWCQRNGLKTGADWLRLWMASIFQQPFQPLPYIFMWGPQNGGKSSYHELFGVLMTKGYKNVDKAFTRQTTFNAEFAGTIVAVIEEANLMSNAEKAYNTIKDVTTARTIAIEWKGKDAYEARNSIHCIQVANSFLSCPILESDDSRIVVIEVPVLPPEKRVAKPALLERWEAEAPDFLRTLLDLKLPKRCDSDDRLYLPVLATPAKWKVIEGVAEVTRQKPSERPAAILAQQIEEPIRALALRNELVRVSASEILAKLQKAGVPDLPERPDPIGQAIKHLDLDGLVLDKGRDGDKRWYTIAPPGSVASCEPKRDEAKTVVAT